MHSISEVVLSFKVTRIQGQTKRVPRGRHYLTSHTQESVQQCGGCPYMLNDQDDCPEASTETDI